MAKDRGLHSNDWDSQLAVTRTVAILEQSRAYFGNDLPISFECINVALGNPAAQMSVNVLQVLRLAAINVARKIQIVGILCVADFRDRNHA